MWSIAERDLSLETNSSPFSTLSANGHPPTKIFADAFSAFGGWAIDEPFETPKRSFSPDLIEDSPFKGGAEIIPRKYSFYGSLAETHRSAPDLFSFEMALDVKPERVKQDLQTMFYRAYRAKESGLFIDHDFAMANGEIHASGTLTHGYRKLSHIVATEVVLRIVEESN